MATVATKTLSRHVRAQSGLASASTSGAGRIDGGDQTETVIVSSKHALFGGPFRLGCIPRLNFSSRAARCCGLFEMIKCSRCAENAPAGCLREPKLCGKCCWPRCGDNIHGQRHKSRGTPGRTSKEEKWQKAWKLAQANVVAMWRNPPLRRYMLETGVTFGSIRYMFMKEILALLRDTLVEDEGTSVAVAVAMPPRERDELVDQLKQELGEDTELPAYLEAALVIDDEADPEDMEALRTSDAAPAVTFAASSSCSSPGPQERSPKRIVVASLAEQTSMPSSSSAPAWQGPVWNPQGKPVLDEKGKACSHYCRRTPPFHSIPWKKTQAPTMEQRALSYATAEEVLKAWLAVRPGLLASFSSIEVRRYPWLAKAEDADLDLSSMHSWGVYIYCKLADWIPKPRDDIDVTTSQSTLYREAMEDVIHASSMYSVHKSVLGGLHPGTKPGKGGRTGLYCFRPVGAYAAGSSSGYAVYSWIGGPFLASPRYDIAAEVYRAGEEGIGKIAMGSEQLALQPGMYFLRGVYFHLVTREDAARGPPTDFQWDDWIPEHELAVE